jgi:RNA ligase (TIGR02306 family)
MSTQWTSKLLHWLGLGGRNAAPAASTGNTDTEFSAEVVRVTQVLPHPNADRLEIIRFEMKDIGETTYEVVSQKGNFQPGDLAAYFSVDCLLPTTHPDFKFLTERLDGAGKTTYRLRAARLRGVFSQGLLVPCPSGKSFGEGVAEEFGVSYYRAPEPGDSHPSQPGTGKKPRTQPIPIYGVESLKKVPRLFADGELVCVTEKIHGTNFRFGWIRRKVLGIPFGWKFVVGSHRVIKDGQDNHFYGEDVWSQYAERNNLAARTKRHKGFVFYGELYGYTYSGQKIQDLTYDCRPEDGPELAMFDVKTPQGWLDPEQRLALCIQLDLPQAPFLGLGWTWSPDLLRTAEGKSLFAPKQIREGIVVESYAAPRRKAKYVGEGYLMRKGA